MAAQDLLVRIDATAAGFSAALAKAELSTYKFETSLQGLNAAILQLDRELATIGPRAMAAAAAMAEVQAAAVVATTKKIGSAFGIVGAAAGLAFYEIEKSTASLDSRLAVVNSLVRANASELKGLRQAAMTAGAGIAVSASGAADAEIELAKAGISAADIIGGALRGALTLAAAGQADISDATTVAAAAMSEFALKGVDVPHIADLIAAGADRSLGSVTDLGYALAQAGTTAHQAGLSLEETTGALAAFAAAGLIGERGGTTLKQVLLQLEAPTDKAQEIFDQFNFSLYDAAGNMKTIPALAGALNKSFGDLEPKVRNAALATIFGSRAVQGANILMQQGVVGMQVWNAKVNDQGFAAQQAADKLDSLTGDLEKFQTAMSTTFAGAGEGAVSPLRDLVELGTTVLNIFNELPGPIKSGVVDMLALVAVVGLAGFAYSRLSPALESFKVQMAETNTVLGLTPAKMMAARAGAAGLGVALLSLGASAGDSHEALGVLGKTAGAAALGFSVGGPWGAAIGGGIGLLTGLEGAFHDAGAEARQAILDNADYAASLDDVTAAATKATKTQIAQTLADADVLTASEALGISTGDLVNAIAGVPGATQKVNTELAALSAQYDANSESLARQYQAYLHNSQIVGESAMSFSEFVGTYRSGSADIAKNIHLVSDVLGQQRAKLAENIKSQKDQIQALKEARKAAYEHGRAIRGDADAIDFHTHSLSINYKWLQKDIEAQNKLADLYIQQRHDAYALAAATDEANSKLATITGTLNKHTAAGQRNEQMLEDFATTWNDSTTEAQNANGAYDKTFNTMVNLIEAMGKTHPVAVRMAHDLLDIPEVKRVANLETRQALEDAKILGIKLADVKPPELRANLEVLDAMRNATDLGKYIEQTLFGIPDEGVNVNLTTGASKILASIMKTFQNISPFELGGEVRGGRPGKDSVPALLEPDEHVWTTEEVAGAGGHGAVRGLRRLARMGELGNRGDISYFAAGGEVGVVPHLTQHGAPRAANAVSAVAHQVALAMSQELSGVASKILTTFPTAGMLGFGGVLTPAQLVRGQNFASGQVGKPYVWGGVGPGGYDCSGFQSAVLNSAVGAYPYSRRGSTGTAPWPGSAPGVGRYTMGWSTNVGGSGIGHMSGNIGGLNVESYGGHGPAVGSGARSPLDSMFNGLMHYDNGGRLRPGWTLAHNGTGVDERVQRFAGGGAVLQAGVQVGQGGGGTSPTSSDVVSIAELLRRAFHHFYFGPNATADKTKSEVQDLVSALREALGKDSPLLEHVRNLGDKLIDAAKAQDRVSAHLDALREKMDAYASSVTATFRHDPFNLGGTANLLTQLRADRNDARKMHQALRKARSKGLDGGLFKALAASGDLETAQQLAHMTPAEIHRYEVLYQQRQKATRTLGDYAGQQVFGKDIHGIRRELGHLNHQIRHLEHAINHIGPHVEHGARRGTHDGARDGMREQGRRAAHGIR